MSIPIEDIAKFNLSNIINPEHAKISTRTVHITAEEYLRIRPLIEAQDIEIHLKNSGGKNINHTERMPYDSSLVLRPLEHGDFVCLKESIVEKNSKIRMGGAIGIVKRTQNGLVVDGIGWRSKDFTRMIQRRIDVGEVPEADRIALQGRLPNIQAKTVDVELHINATEQDPKLLRYLLKQRAHVSDEIRDGETVRKFTLVVNRR